MITIAKYEKIAKSGLLLDHFFILNSVLNGDKLPETERIKGFYNLLEKRGLIVDGKVHQSAMYLFEEEAVSTSICMTTTYFHSLKPFDFVGWSLGMHEKCQNKLIELTDKKQVRDKINGKAYSFLPNAMDLSKVLLKVIKLYKKSDLDLSLIEKCLYSYMEKCNKANNWFPVLDYYIWKNNKSTLITDMENMENDETSGDSGNFTSETWI